MTVMRNERLAVVTGLNLDEQAMLTLGISAAPVRCTPNG